MVRRILLVFACPALLSCGEPGLAPTQQQVADSEATAKSRATAANEGRVLAQASAGEKKMIARTKNAFSAQVAGGFYPDQPAELRRQVEGFLAAAKTGDVEADRDVVGVLAPHAGYRYSGPVAGEAYRVLAGRGYRTVVVLALSHRRSARKASVLSRPAYDTPLGSLEIDRHAVQELLEKHGDVFDTTEQVFIGEHSLEVQLPFIQVALPEARVIPIIVAVHEEEIVDRVGRALFQEFGDRRDVAFAISSDLSHFFPYDEAKRYDLRSLELLENWKIEEWKGVAPRQQGMCGYLPMLSFVRMFEGYEKAVRRVRRLSYKNSGDTAGDRAGGVVGYGALAFSVDKGTRQATGSEEEFGPFNAATRRELMQIAKDAVAAAVRGKEYLPAQPSSARLRGLGAAFVTLKKNGDLRGCIGHVVARVPLFRCVSSVARAAAIHDSRFSPVGQAEIRDLNYEISVLTAPERTTPEQVVVGRDGLIMSRGGRSGLLLPQVPLEWGWNREEFLAHTCRKAGLPLDCWKDSETEIQSFRAIVWGEEDLDD